MPACGCLFGTASDVPARVLSTRFGDAAIRRRLRCDDCARTWTQIEVRDGEEGDR